MLDRINSKDKSALAAALADSVVADLKAGLAERDAAVLVVSGGSTPKMFFAELSTRDDLDWSKVMITLVDERWVAPSSDRSNARLVMENLLQGSAKAATFVPLYTGGEEPSADLIAETNRLQEQASSQYDAVILGMGNDGHTASFFPGGDALMQTLTDAGPALAIRAPGAGEPRVTLTLPRLLNTRSLYLHIEGAEKAETLERALGDGETADMPIRAVLRQTSKKTTIYWCP